jgi:ribosomal protein L9
VVADPLLRADHGRPVLGRAASGVPFRPADVDPCLGGRLFGSVTNFDIAEELTKMGFPVAKAQVRMPNGPIKTVGDSTVTVALHTDVVVEINVTVYGETA